MAILKSVLSFAQENGYVAFNVGKMLKAPPVKNRLAECILSEPDVTRMISLEPNRRNRALLTVLYGGLRISEVCGLCWRDLVERGGAAQATVYGKGCKTWVVLLASNIWPILLEIRGDEPTPASTTPMLCQRCQVNILTKSYGLISRTSKLDFGHFGG